MKLYFIFSSIALVSSISFAGLRRLAPEDICFSSLNKYFASEMLINYDFKTKKVTVASPSDDGKFTVFSNKSETTVDGRSCLANNESNAYEFLSSKLDFAAERLSKSKPYYGLVGQLNGNPTLFNSKVDELSNVLSSCSDIEDSELKKTVNKISSKYFENGSSATSSGKSSEKSSAQGTSR